MSKKVHSVFFQHDKANDSPFLGVHTRVFRVTLPDVAYMDDRYIFIQEIHDSSSKKLLTLNNELPDVTEDCHAQRIAIDLHNNLVQTVTENPERALRWIERARRGENPYEDDEMAPRVGEAQPLALPRRVLESLRDSAQTILDATNEMLAGKEDTLDDAPVEGPTPVKNYVVGDLVLMRGKHDLGIGRVTEMAAPTTGRYAVDFERGGRNVAWGYFSPEILEPAEPPAPLPNLGAPIPDAEPVDLTPSDDTF